MSVRQGVISLYLDSLVRKHTQNEAAMFQDIKRVSLHADHAWGFYMPYFTLTGNKNGLNPIDSFFHSRTGNQ